jgi:putative tricarboxylic transport membrane protein
VGGRVTKAILSHRCEVDVKQSSLVAGALFLAFSLVVAATSLSMEYYSSLGPGPGFFPFWLGALLAVMSSIWIVQVYMGRNNADEGTRFLPESGGIRRVSLIVGALVLLVVGMETLGFQLSMFVFLFVLLFVLGRVRPWLTTLVAAVGSFGLNYLFTTWLDVKLPVSSLSVLAVIGL